jgi:hypothetical protein
MGKRRRARKRPAADAAATGEDGIYWTSYSDNDMLEGMGFLIRRARGEKQARTGRGAFTTSALRGPRLPQTTAASCGLVSHFVTARPGPAAKAKGVRKSKTCVSTKRTHRFLKEFSMQVAINTLVIQEILEGNRWVRFPKRTHREGLLRPFYPESGFVLVCGGGYKRARRPFY